QRSIVIRSAEGSDAGSVVHTGSLWIVAPIVDATSSPLNARRPPAILDARSHFEQAASQRPDVGPLVARLATRLFRAHVGRGPENDARRRHRGARYGRGHREAGHILRSRAGSLIDRLRQPEVEHLHGAVGSDLD